MTAKKKQMITALEKSHGVVTTACSKAKVGRATHYLWMSKDEEYKAAVEEVSEMALDFTESQLFSLIQDKHPASIFFYLKCKGKARGYIEKPDYENNELKIIDSQIERLVNLTKPDPEAVKKMFDVVDKKDDN